MEIVVSQKGAELFRYTFNQGIISIGRDVSNEISLPSPAATERHARISLFDDICVIQRLDPAGTLFVNGDEVDRTRLYDQDTVMIGQIKLSVLGRKLVRTASDPTPHRMTRPEGPQPPESGDADREPSPRIDGMFTPFEDGKSTDGKSDDEIQPASIEPDSPGVHRTAPPEIDEPKTSLLSTGVDLLTGPAQGRRVLFTGKSARLGIKDDSVVSIKPSQHGYMVSAANHFIVATVNGKRLTDKPQRLSHGDLIEFTDLKARFFVNPE